MKVFLANIFYFVGAIAWTYGFQWILILWIGGLRFSAADGPPGDISMGSKLVYSVGFPLFHFVLLTVGLLLYSYILRNFSTKFKKKIPIIFNVIITAYIIWQLVYVVFDYHL